MIFLAGATLALIAANGWAMPTQIMRPDEASSIHMSLEQEGNSIVKASITNTGDKVLNLLKRGTILDERKVQKFAVMSKDGSAIPFEGLKLSLHYGHLPPSAFQTITPNETIAIKMDIAEVHDLGAGGHFKILARGEIPHAEIGTTRIKGAIPYHSSDLALSVHGPSAHVVRRYYRTALQKRTQLNMVCPTPNLLALATAHAHCQNMASHAAEQISTPLFKSYFKTSDGLAQTEVSKRLLAVADECGNLTAGVTTSSCTDSYDGCDEGVLAYTVPMENAIVYCDSFFKIPARSDECHGQDQAGVVLHELTHAPAVYNPGTEDHAYGFEGIMELSKEKALGNADTYALFAGAVDLGCST